MWRLDNKSFLHGLKPRPYCIKPFILVNVTYSRTSWIPQSVRADAVSREVKTTQQPQVAPLPALHRRRMPHQVHQAGRLRTSRAFSPWPSSSISTTTSTNTLTRTNTSRLSCTPQLPHSLWWDSLCWCVEHLCYTSSVAGMCTIIFRTVVLTGALLLSFSLKSMQAKWTGCTDTL